MVTRPSMGNRATCGKWWGGGATRVSSRMTDRRMPGLKARIRRPFAPFRNVKMPSASIEKNTALKLLLIEAREHVENELNCTLEGCCVLDADLQPIRGTLEPAQVDYVAELESLIARIDAALSVETQG